MIDSLSTLLIGNNWSKFEEFRLGNCKGLPTGFPQIDRKIGGLPNLVCVMGEPKTGKSTFVMNIILEKARIGHPIIYIERENGLLRTRQRMLCYLSDLTLPTVRKSIMSPGEQKQYEQAVSTLCNLPIYYLDMMKTKEQLEELFLCVEKQYNEHVVVVVDSLQSLITDYKDRRGDVDGWVNFFNDLKKKYEHRITIIMVSEKNRQAYGAAGRAGAKESGGVEYKSELVLDLFPGKEPNTIILEATYYRDGESGVLGMFSQDDPFTYRFKVVERERLP